MVSTGSVSGRMQNWICPNDRQLALRAKLGAGWSVHTSKVMSFANNDQLSAEETQQILNVIKQAEKLDQTEMERIGHLVDRVENLRKNALGNGSSECVLCGDEFGVFGASPAFCDDCVKAVCLKCRVDTYNSDHIPIWLCKICSENRELWKKSGAWFYKGLPKYVKPSGKKADSLPLKYMQSNWSPVTSSRPHSDRGREGGNVTGSAEGVAQWAHSVTRRQVGEKSETDSSDSDDEFNIRRKRVKPPDSAESDCISFESSFSNQLNRSCSMTSSQAGSQLSITESGREDHHDDDLSSATGLTLDDSKGALSLSCDSQFLTNQSSKPLDANNASSCLSEDEVQTPSCPETPCPLGSVEFTLLYDSGSKTLDILVLRAKGLPAMDSNGLSDPYVKLHLLPGASKANKLRTKTIPKTLNPEWNETLKYYGLTEADMFQKTLRLTVLDEDRFGFDFIGETRVPLKSIKSGQAKKFNVYLSGLVVDRNDGASASVDRGRILLCLSYSTQKEELIVGIKKCAGLIAMDSNGYSDPYVKIYLKSDKDKKTKRKTKVKSKTLNPEFNETFSYPVKLADLSKMTLEVTVWDKDFGKKSDFIGGIRFEIKSKGDVLRHWYDVLKSPNKEHEQWHSLSTDVLDPQSK